MNTPLPFLAAAAACVLLAACSGSEPVALDAGSDEPRLSTPTDLPAAEGPVRSADLVTVIDTGTGPVELCVGDVAESYPPQCSGPAVPNWDWDTHGGGGSQEASGVRWGLYSVTGTWDGSEFTVSDTLIAALYDSFFEEPPVVPTPATAYSAEELETIGNEVDDLPGSQARSVDAEHVYVSVPYDDGAIQAYVDQAYGEDVVLVTSALVDIN